MGRLKKGKKNNDTAPPQNNLQPRRNPPTLSSPSSLLLFSSFLSSLSPSPSPCFPPSTPIYSTTPPPPQTPPPTPRSQSPTQDYSNNFSQSFSQRSSQSPTSSPSSERINNNTPSRNQDEVNTSDPDQGFRGFIEDAARPPPRMPRGWYDGNWDGVTNCENDDVKQGREYLLCGHVNLNRSPACAAMFAKHQADEAGKFTIDKRGNILDRQNLPRNKKREGRPHTVSEWRQNFGGNDPRPGPSNGGRGQGDDLPPDPTNSQHNMMTRKKKAHIETQSQQAQTQS